MTRARPLGIPVLEADPARHDAAAARRGPRRAGGAAGADLVAATGLDARAPFQAVDLWWLCVTWQARRT